MLDLLSKPQVAYSSSIIIYSHVAMQAAPSCRPTYLFTIDTIIPYQAIRLHRENWLG